MRTPVIIDTDPGVDDIIAILLALASPELEILAIIVSYGNTDLDSSHANLIKLFDAISQSPAFTSYSKPLIARGASHPVQGELHSAVYFHGRDGLGDISTRYPNLSQTGHGDNYYTLTDKNGMDLAFELIYNSEKDSITYIALGPLTNLFHIVNKDPDMFNHTIGRVICMGGALEVPGNTTPVAEFNFYADPFAVNSLLIAQQPPLLSHSKFLLLPLDITTPHELPFKTYATLVDPNIDPSSSSSTSPGLNINPLTTFTTSFLQRTREIMLQFGKDAMELHDIVAVWCAISNPPMHLTRGWEASKRIFEIERLGEITRGMCVVDRRIDESAYDIGANREEEEQIKRKLNHLPRHTDPVLVEVETEAQARVELDKMKHPDERGIMVVHRTPGPLACLELLLHRVWGVELGDH